MGSFELPEDEARHAIKVLRARVGDSFQLIDGIGGSADAEIVKVGQRNCVVEVSEILQTQAPSPEGMVVDRITSELLTTLTASHSMISSLSSVRRNALI